MPLQQGFCLFYFRIFKLWDDIVEQRTNNNKIEKARNKEKKKIKEMSNMEKIMCSFQSIGRLCVCVSVCSLLRYRLNIILPPLPEI